MWGTAIVILAFFAGTARGQSLHVTSFPDGANVFIDGVDSGKLTPMASNLTPGTHVIKVQLTGSTGWNTDTRTVDTYNGDVHLSVTLLPTLTQGPPGPQGIPGKDSTVPGPSGPSGISVVAVAEPPSVNCVYGGSRFLAVNGTFFACNGLVGKDGAVGPAGKDSTIPGPQGIPGPPGAGSYHGTWTPTGTYNEGDMVFRDKSVGGSRGPFWCVNEGGCSSTADPAVDSADWTFCCGTATLGYSANSTSGNFNGTFNPGYGPASLNGFPYTYTVDNPATFATLTVTVSSVSSQTTQTAQVKCYVLNGAPTPFFSNRDGYATPCSSTAGLTEVNSFGDGEQEWSGTQTATVQQTPGAMTWTLYKNGVATCLTVTASTTGTFTSPPCSAVSYGGSDTFDLRMANPSTAADTVSGSWQVQ